MGELISGKWQRSGMESVLADGELRRPPSVFRNWITPKPDSPFKAEPGRGTTSMSRSPARGRIEP